MEKNLPAKISHLFTNPIIPRKLIKDGYVAYSGFTTYIPIDSLEEFKNNILMTRGEYVYPTVFTSIAQKKILNEKSLYLLRVWANILRLRYGTSTKIYNDYYAYRLYLKTLQFTHDAF